MTNSEIYDGQFARCLASIKFAFYGRVSTEDQQDPESSRGWQLTRSRALIDARDGVIVTEFFDVDKSRSIPWQRRPQATALLAELKNPDRGFDAVVIGEPHRAFYGNQYGLTFPLFEHYGVPLWVPEVGGPIDPRNEAHDLVMSVFGGMSKGERNRIKIRVKAAMGAQAKDEGRFLGGRPPYGYLIADAGPHPNPAKAADGKRLHKLDIDPEAMPVVVRSFSEFGAGSGLYAIAEGLTRDGIPSPSAHDPGRNSHRSGIAWSKFAVRAILANPRYTGHQVWSARTKCSWTLNTSRLATRPSFAGTRPTNGSGQTRWSTRRSSSGRTGSRCRYSCTSARATPPSTSRTPPSIATRCEAACGAACATGGCKATGSTRARTTGAGSLPTTPWRTRSSTR